MYLKYLPAAGATAIQVWQDLCDSLTGVPIANLSASCDKTNSQLVASISATPWTMHDAAASASSKVLKSQNADGTYKYLSISYATTTITCMVYETWNATTHAGTNEAIYSTAISATPQLLTVTTAGFTLLTTLRNTVFTQGSARTFIVGEFSRDSLTLDASYPCTFIAGFTSGLFAQTGTTPTAISLSCAGLCRIKYANSAGDLKKSSTPAFTDAMAGMVPHGGYANYHMTGSSLTAAIRPAGTELITYIARPFYIQSTLGLSTTCHALGKVPDIFHMSLTANHLDEISVNGTTYVILCGMVLVPKE